MTDCESCPRLAFFNAQIADAEQKAVERAEYMAGFAQLVVDWETAPQSVAMEVLIDKEAAIKRRTAVSKHSLPENLQHVPDGLSASYENLMEISARRIRRNERAISKLQDCSGALIAKKYVLLGESVTKCHFSFNGQLLRLIGMAKRKDVR